MAIDLREFQKDCHAQAIKSGWWDNRSQALREAKLTLVHSEISEAAECVRIGDMGLRIAESGKPEGFVVELADAVIRMLDVDLAYGFDVPVLEYSDRLPMNMTPEEILADLHPIHRSISNVWTLDAIVKCFELADRLNLNLMTALTIKHAYNKTRPYKHGKKA